MVTVLKQVSDFLATVTRAELKHLHQELYPYPCEGFWRSNGRQTAGGTDAVHGADRV